MPEMVENEKSHDIIEQEFGKSFNKSFNKSFYRSSNRSLKDEADNYFRTSFFREDVRYT